ncbi:uncharacterized protein LOC118274342 [Spodoptera frugiperda]|uniref:Uncharacterized protein LOC118274342 n=1 Tax=Spodoptera frugiperda TaxID=7108 RepID=A0A9R0E9C7_SPOFR|nr:uncharacterized protein LOC118274342 [Spodoptera frugiperda]
MTRSHFKRPATPMGGAISDSGESDCSQMSTVSQKSTVSTRARKRTRTTDTSEKASVVNLPGEDKNSLEKLTKENAELRAQIACLKEAVVELKNQLSTLSQQGEKPETQASTSGLAPDIVAQLRRSIAIEIGGMMDAKLAALEDRLLPEKRLRPALASDARTPAVSSPPVQTEAKANKKKKKKKKGQTSTPVVSELPAVSTPTVLVPNRQTAKAVSQETWSLVVGRKAKKVKTPQPADLSAQSRIHSVQKKQRVKLPKVPTSAAISICVKEGATVGLGEVMSVARRQINIVELGITTDLLREKRAADGGIVLMISGQDSASKADGLATRMREVLADFAVVIRRPTKMAEARVMDLDDAITPEEVVAAIARVGGCSAEDVKIGEIRRPPTSLGHVWVRGPLAAMKKLASDKRMPLGWTSVRVEVLEPRRMMCYRCFEPGHVRSRCTSATDRSTQCYACGGAHKARECTSQNIPSDVGCTTRCRPSRGNGHITFPALRVLQCNLNHCRSAQNLFLQTVAEWSVALAVVAEPYGLQDHPRWFRDSVDSVAIYWAGGSGGPHCCLLDSGQGFVAVEWGPIAVVGCYVSPNISLQEYEAYLDGIANCIRCKCSPRPVLVLGDFNAHSRAWGSTRDRPRGHAVQDWAASLDLRLLNRGSVPTCVRWQGESIVDLTWATPSLASRIVDWRVAEEIVTLSDHRHIVFDVATSLADGRSGATSNPPTRRWALKKLDREMLIAAANVVAWPEESSQGISPDPEGEAVWFRDKMASICDASMPRIRCGQRPGAAYWWSADIAHLRSVCLRLRRQFQRARRRRQPSATEEQITRAYREYRDATMALQRAILDAKSRSWKELLEGLNRDPWGRPYRLVMGKLRPWVPPLTETMDPDLLERVISTLFPVVRDSPSLPLPSDWSSDLGVTEGELGRAVRRMSVRNTAPGPDGVPGRVWALVMHALGNRLRRLFDSCLQTSVFPIPWKEAGLVLLKKQDRPAESPSAYRPICLLDEVSKLFERVIAERLVEHLSRVGPDLSECQYGFRQQRSTIDAILRVRSLSDQAVSRGGVALAISLDIVNAFNSLPWKAIREALVHHRVPPYLQNIVGAYLRDRRIRYVGRDGSVQQREITCGVPQGSVLGPLLWNLAYDAVLRVDLPAGVHIVCYADDTLVMASGNTFEETIRLSELGVAKVVASIHELGLKIAPQKTEALWFHKLPRTREPPSSSVRVGDAQVQVGRYLKYLGLTLDSRWGFEEHFERLVPRVEKAVGALHRLLPNIGGPREEHTLEECTAWESERRVLVARIGRDLSLPAVITAMLTEAENWREVASFCETVMSQKEAAERDRERDPTRRRRRGGNRRGA